MVIIIEAFYVAFSSKNQKIYIYRIETDVWKDFDSYFLLKKLGIITDKVLKRKHISTLHQFIIMYSNQTQRLLYIQART